MKVMFKPLQLRFRGTVGGIIPINATGGEVFDYPIPGTDEIYRYHVFTAPTNFAVQEISNKFNDIEYLVIAGGGGGGAADNEQEAGGGAGAGGWREVSQTLTSPTTLSVFVGAGGVGRGGRGNCVPGTRGVNSAVGSFSSAGGGAGLPPRQGNPGGIANGGSGGGGTERTSAVGSGNVPATNPSQGNSGTIDYVDGPNFNSFRTYGGGGGGISAGGRNSSGGAGKGSTLFDSSVRQAYFNAGYTKQIGVGTSAIFSRGGDGGRRTFSGGASGAPFSGNGGQGGRADGERAGNPRQQMNPGGNGGSGAVIIRYRIQ
jgi:hypothetical protein